MRATVYGMPASHPVQAAVLMLAHKRIGWRRIDLPSARSVGCGA